MSVDKPINKNNNELQTNESTSHVSSTASFSFCGIRVTLTNPNVIADETTAITPETCMMCSANEKLLYAKTIDIIRYALIFAFILNSNSLVIRAIITPINRPPKNTLRNSRTAT